MRVQPVGITNTKLSENNLQTILEQAEKTSFERLKHKTTMPTFFINNLLDSPSNWRLRQTFFEIDIKDQEKKLLIHELIEKIESIAIKECKQLLEEQDYYVNFEEEEPIIYRGLYIDIRVNHEDIYLNSVKLGCLDFSRLCECIQLKAYAKIYFENLQHEISFYCVSLASYVFGAAANEVRGENDFQKKLSESNKSKANKRWSKHNENRTEKKKQYLEIMRLKGFSTFTDTAEYIKQHIETDKKPSYDTIKRWLSQASKGDFL